MKNFKEEIDYELVYGDKAFFLPSLQQAKDFKVIERYENRDNHPSKIIAFGRKFDCSTKWIDKGYGDYYIRCYLR
jgi:hypothetical protein